jgi:hypothetical protein
MGIIEMVTQTVILLSIGLESFTPIADQNRIVRPEWHGSATSWPLLFHSIGHQ